MPRRAMHPYPKRASLEGLEIEIFKLVSYSSTPDLWEEWIRVPLEHATARGNLHLFNKLLEAGANVSAGWRGFRDRTLLHTAAVGGNKDIVLGLLRAGARPDVDVVSLFSGRSALYTAASLGHEAVASALIVVGADVNFEDPVDKRSVLAEAALGGHERLVTDLVIGGADVHARSMGGFTPLHGAASGTIVSTLLLAGSDKDAFSLEGVTPLISASDRGQLCVVETLLAAGANSNFRQDHNNFSALDTAALRGHAPVLQALIGHGVEINDRDEEGLAAIHSAAYSDQVGSIDILVEAGADIELKSNDGCSPFLHAAIQGKLKSMLALRKHGARLDASDSDGYTALHLVCYYKDERLEVVVDLLLRLGADQTALNHYGRTPVEMLDKMPEPCDDYNLVNHDEIERTRLLLYRAPVDRVWRRRGWMVMLRARAEKGGRGADGPEDERCKAAKREVQGGHGMHGQVSSDGRFKDVVELVVGYAPDFMFRMVLSFL